MAPTIPLAPQSAYTPTSDVMARHEYGVTKARKPASTGGGRAWSEEEVRFFDEGRGTVDATSMGVGPDLS